MSDSRRHFTLWAKKKRKKLREDLRRPGALFGMGKLLVGSGSGDSSDESDPHKSDTCEYFNYPPADTGSSSSLS